ncbi:MAG: TIGR04282 family arsenosugar biosynthesis glycosyltransferase [Gammaproteobacteria bacterium]
MPVATIMFARAPEVGAVKTRLIPALGARGACRLHEALVRRTAATCLDAATGPVYLACTPAIDAPLFVELCASGVVRPIPQRGQDLGTRMLAALRDTIESVHPAIDGALIVGCDIPSLDSHDLSTAARWLESGVPAVLGPALDGGYFLIGLREPAQSLFEGIAWGTDSVLGATRQKLADSGLNWRELAARRDVDRPEDLNALQSTAPELSGMKNQ